jgi:hypothetical protein
MAVNLCKSKTLFSRCLDSVSMAFLEVVQGRDDSDRQAEKLSGIILEDLFPVDLRKGHLLYRIDRHGPLSGNTGLFVWSHLHNSSLTDYYRK